MSDKLPMLPGSRAIGVLAGNQVYVPALPANGEAAAAYRDLSNAQLGAILSMDRFYTAAVMFQSGRHLLHDSVAEREAREEERKDILHQRMVAEIRRERELHEEKLEALEVRHRYEAVEEFKPIKTLLGKARFKQRVAEAQIGEAVAREGMKEEILEPQAKPTDVKLPSMAEQFARMVDDMEKQIDEAEAAGTPTEEMRAEQNTLNKLLRRELLKGK